MKEGPDRMDVGSVLRRIILASIVVLVLGNSRAAGATYRLEDLGPLTNAGGREDAKPYAINTAGKVAAANATGGAYRGWIYGGSWTNLGTLGGTESIAGGLNDSDQVAGYSLTAGGLTRAFLWTPGGTDGVAGNRQMKDLGTLGGSNSEAYDVNDLGQVTGYAQTANRYLAFIYANGSMRDLGQLSAGFPNTFGYAINNAGRVAGVAYSNNFNSWRAFYYNGTSITAIGGLGGGDSMGLGINDADQVVGYASTSSGVDHAILWADGVTTDLGTLGGGYSYAFGINDLGEIVGGSFVDAADTLHRAFLYSANSMVDLNTLVDASGTGWTLVEARSINDGGQIVGVARYQGTDRAFRLTPVDRSAPPSITGIQVVGLEVRISFTTQAGAAYALEGTTALNPSPWTPVQTGIAGTGGVVTAAHTGGAGERIRCYRIRRESP
jgi:probable HAF family extracellular repeat protein